MKAPPLLRIPLQQHAERVFDQLLEGPQELGAHRAVHHAVVDREGAAHQRGDGERAVLHHRARLAGADRQDAKSEEHTSELQSLMRISYAVFCLKKKKTITQKHHTRIQRTHEQNNTKESQTNT